MNDFAGLLNQALELPTPARADLAYRLLESLDNDHDTHPGSQVDLSALIMEREALVDSGNFTAYGAQEEKQLAIIAQITKQVFPASTISVESSTDPEYPQTTYLVHRVTLARQADISSIIDGELAWYRKVSELAPNAIDKVRLVVE
jgi:hypothetical protein